MKAKLNMQGDIKQLELSRYNNERKDRAENKRKHTQNNVDIHTYIQIVISNPYLLARSKYFCRLISFASRF
jgi:hypothetical protein